MSMPPEPGERVVVEFADGVTGELPPWPTPEQLAERDAWIDARLAELARLFPGGSS